MQSPGQPSAAAIHWPQKIGIQGIWRMIVMKQVSYQHKNVASNRQARFTASS